MNYKKIEAHLLINDKYKIRKGYCTCKEYRYQLLLTGSYSNIKQKNYITEDKIYNLIINYGISENLIDTIVIKTNEIKYYIDL